MTADRRGRISAHLTVPRGTGAGVYAVTATGRRSQIPATATIGVIAPAVAGDSVPQVRSTLVLSSPTAMPGERVTASGTGYRPNETVTLTGTTGTGTAVRLAQVRANGDGVFTVAFVVPAVSGGLASVTTDNAAAAGTPTARAPLRTVRRPHGS